MIHKLTILTKHSQDYNKVSNQRSSVINYSDPTISATHLVTLNSIGLFTVNIFVVNYRGIGYLIYYVSHTTANIITMPYYISTILFVKTCFCLRNVAQRFQPTLYLLSPLVGCISATTYRPD